MLVFFQRHYLLLIILILVVAGTVTLYFFVSSDKCPEKKVTKEEQIVPSPEKVGAGNIGEIYQEDKTTGLKIPVVSPTLPPAIFSTTGRILEIKPNSLIVKGDGYNFADRVQRDLIINFSDNTITFAKNHLKNYYGKEGLKYLKPGMKILISSQDNIRGKVEFEAKTVNVLE